MVAITIVSRHPTPHFLESGAALLLLLGIATRTAAAVVTLFELWLLAMRSGAWTSALLATMALAVALIGPGSWSLDTQWLGWRRIDIRRHPKQQTQRSIPLTANGWRFWRSEIHAAHRRGTGGYVAASCTPLLRWRHRRGTLDASRQENLWRAGTYTDAAARVLPYDAHCTSRESGFLLGIVAMCRTGDRIESAVPGHPGGCCHGPDGCGDPRSQAGAVGARHQGDTPHSHKPRWLLHSRIHPPGAVSGVLWGRTGFQLVTFEHVEIRVGDRLTLDARLTIGQIDSTVTVTADATPLLQTGSASIGTVVDRRRIEELPLPDGNPFTLARSLRVVAFTDVNNFCASRGHSTTAGRRASPPTAVWVASRRVHTWTVCPNNAAFGRRSGGTCRPAEAVQEFNDVASSPSRARRRAASSRPRSPRTRGRRRWTAGRRLALASWPA